ncbi:MAG TPA: hypothetical protein VKY54_11145 [Kiloniellales bacterium]|jgi:hypothetical protein|nr:hypothetical protein [Kiloniellales bacterium]
MERLRKETLDGLVRQLASFRWSEAEIKELVAPEMGVITSFQDLLDDLERLRQMDLGDTPPADRRVQAGDRG